MPSSVKSKRPRTYQSQAKWKGSFLWSCPNPEELPKRFLSLEEIEFIEWLRGGLAKAQQQPQSGRQLLKTAGEVAEKLKELWGDLLEGVSVSSIAKNLFWGRSYTNKEYWKSGRCRGLWLFRKGLIRAYPMPVKQAKYQLWYGYPRERYRLTKKNYRAKYPPHDALAGWCYEELWKGVSEGVMRKAKEELLKIPQWDGSGNYTADNCYRVVVDGKTTYYWFEIHTGSEGYDEKVFIPRLLTAELQLRGRGKYVVIVPFGKDVDKARKASD